MAFGPGFAITASSGASLLLLPESRWVGGARFEEGFSWGALVGRAGELAFVFLRALTVLGGRASVRCSQLSAM